MARKKTKTAKKEAVKKESVYKAYKILVNKKDRNGK
jgi:hypothetical protein